MAAVKLRNLQKNAEKLQEEKEKYEDLLVFGYQCKMFRDDEKAQMIEAGHFLVPWNGDEKLLIDRHDGRGYLMDLCDYDADKITKDLTLTEEERSIEEQCDRERFLELHVDVNEQEVYEEENLKRSSEESQKYAAVGFVYENTEEKKEEKNDEINITTEDDEDFVPAPQMEFPSTTTLPRKLKEHIIIEKTAQFVAEHGPQMEIMIRTKQKNKPEFEFLESTNALFPYYQILIRTMKSGRYFPPIRKPKGQSDGEDSNDDDDDEDGGYLHPSLAPKLKPKTEDNILSVIKKNLPALNISDTPYGKLLSSLGKKPERKEHIENCEEQRSSETARSQNNSPNPVVGPNVHRETSDLKLPAPNVQVVIDKMAEYVAKNGPHFEINVRRRGEEKFSFLASNHPHHSYFIFKREWHLTQQGKDPKDYELQLNAIENEVPPSVYAPPQAVSFSIKKAEEEKHPVPPPPPPPPPPPVIDPEVAKRNAHLQLAREKVAAKLMQVAREKVAEKNKEKMVQAERKKKAALFATMVKSGVLQVTKDDDSKSTNESIGSPSSSSVLKRKSSPLLELDQCSDDKKYKRSSYGRQRHTKRPSSQSPDIVSKVRLLSQTSRSELSDSSSSQSDS